MTSYEDRARLLAEQMRKAEGAVRLGKRTSNLFRHRTGEAKTLNVRDFHHVLAVNVQEGWVEAEGMTTYHELVDETLKHGYLPAVVPQLKSITIGGAVSGVGIEASSFREGLVHETILAMDILLSDGSIITATPENEHRDLFFGMPNSYGTLGYILKVRAKIIPAKKYVHLTHTRFDDAAIFFPAMENASASNADFADGVVFGPTEMYITTGQFTDEAPFTSDYTFQKIYYRSIREKSEDYLTTRNYIWRWDTDWFWCSKNLGMQHPLMRLLMGRKRLHSMTYQKIMRWSARWKIGTMIERLSGTHGESVIQDVCIPIDRSEEFLEFLLKEIGILPIWICPTRSRDTQKRFPLFPLDPRQLYIDFGFWDVIHTQEKHPRGFFNRKVENMTQQLGGLKSLYSESFYDRETFWKIYDRDAYDALKKQYDPEHRLKDLYEKCVSLY